MTSTTQVQPRHFAGEKDLEAIYSLLQACEAYDKLDEPPSLNYLRLDLTSPEVDQARDIRLWEDKSGRLVGCASIGIIEPLEGAGKLSARLHFGVLPEARHQGLETEIIEWAQGRLTQAATERGLKGASLTSGTPEIYQYGRQVLEQAGYQPVRYFFRMARSLNEPIPQPVLPRGYTSRYSKTAEDSAEWCDCYNESFIDHWNHHPITVESARHWNDTNANYVPENDLVAVAPDGHFAAFCYCEVDPEKQKSTGRNEGWIHLVGTRRGYRKIGLGRAMLLTGLLRLKELEVDTAMLGVDAENPTGALGLYESSGFHRARTGIAYGKDWELPAQS